MLGPGDGQGAGGRVWERGSCEEAGSRLDSRRTEPGRVATGPRHFGAPCTRHRCSVYFDRVFIWRALGVSYIIGLAAVTKNKTQNESGLNNTETHFSLPRRSRVAVQRAGPLQGHQRPRSIAPRFSASPARAIPRCRRAAPAPAITSASQKVGRKRGSVTWKRGVPLPLALQRPHLPRGDIQL